MQLTYRGIKYKTNVIETKADDNRAVDRNRLAVNSKEIMVKPICYYTYRGISYTKYPVLSAKQTNFRVL